MTATREIFDIMFGKFFIKSSGEVKTVIFVLLLQYDIRASYHLNYFLHSACLPYFIYSGLNVVSICMNMGNALLKSPCASACKSSK